MGKKGGQESENIYDKGYTKKLADIAERQQEMAEEQWQLYKDHFQEYEIAAVESNKELLPFLTNATKSLYESAEGIDTTRRQDQAEADVVGAYKKVPQAMKMEQAKYGIDPSSNRALGMFRNMGLNESRDIAGARTSARERADTEKFNRLATASGRRPLPTPNISGQAMGGMQMAAGSYSPLANRVIRQEHRDESNLWDFAGDVGATLAGTYIGKRI